ncbi:hypothetical protein GCK72_005198 [Caenorhabditis remanei]|uniref:Uncharacterized protein n=1 Tax=Caenorhabditis remanei TaxID=31234 RepID=A0A6A5HEM0_CAERE|nr:hypothetical protein GCK72_005198 [Caenorhabditis remanei]KAF1765246.1 hypothetical protein GCK72_005198 [Caenorhabditis remanei]
MQHYIIPSGAFFLIKIWHGAKKESTITCVRRANRQFEQDPIDPIQPTEASMNAIYTAVLVASTLAYTAVAWIGLSIDTANEDLL